MNLKTTNHWLFLFKDDQTIGSLYLFKPPLGEYIIMDSVTKNAGDTLATINFHCDSKELVILQFPNIRYMFRAGQLIFLKELENIFRQELS